MIGGESASLELTFSQPTVWCAHHGSNTSTIPIATEITQGKHGVGDPETRPFRVCTGGRLLVGRIKAPEDVLQAVETESVGEESEKWEYMRELEELKELEELEELEIVVLQKTG